MKCVPLTKAQANALWDRAVEQQQERAECLPTIDAALNLLTQAHHRLKELGWREAMYCPKDGTVFEIIEAGSSGIHRCHYDGEWPNGWWVHADGDLCPSHPILWRPIPTDESGAEHGPAK